MSASGAKAHSRALEAASALALPCVAIVVWLGAVAWPLVSLVFVLQSDATASAVQAAAEFHQPRELLVTSLSWAAAVALLAGLLGWLAGRVVGSALRVHGRGFVPLAALALVPLCMPPYVVFYAWWQSWPPESALHQWMLAHGSMHLGRQATLLVSLACWSWPLVALCVAGAAARRPRERDEMLLIDGAPRRLRVLDHLRTDLPGVLLGMLLAALTTLGNTTSFDLAQVFTFANELRARAALGRPAGEILRLGSPMVAIALAGAMLVWWRLGFRANSAATRGSSPSPGAAVGGAIIWLATVLAPLALFWRGIAAEGDIGAAFREFDVLYRLNAMTTLGLAAAAAGVAALAAMGLAAMWHSDRPMMGQLAHVISATWLLMALLPATISGLALQTAYNRGALAKVIYQNPVMLIIAQLAGAGFVAALLARWCAASEPRVLQDLRRLDGATSPLGLWRTARPALLACLLATFALVMALAAGEIAITAQVQPPMPIDRVPLGPILLDAMHYQRPMTVLVGATLMIAVALVAAVAVAFLWQVTLVGRRIARGSLVAALALLLPLALTGCTSSDPENLPPLDQQLAFGTPGQSLGQFGYPRCIDVDPNHQWVYVIDKTARVQRFDFSGQPQLQWVMPEQENGKPTGVSVGPEGNVYVADTHYFRVMVYDSDGHLIRSFGEHGEGPGQFIYVTDIAFGPDGNLYVSEYGGNDRVQVFSPEGQYLFEFGSFGSSAGESGDSTGSGQLHFRRPQSLAFSRDGEELYIADACNHRIVVTDPKGNLLRTFASAGREPGQLCFPYSIEVLPDDTLLVCEFGNNRIQRFDRDGQSLGMYGRVGRGEGELQYPWAVAATEDRIFVLDSGNNRVQVIDMF